MLGQARDTAQRRHRAKGRTKTFMGHLVFERELGRVRIGSPCSSQPNRGRRGPIQRGSESTAGERRTAGCGCDRRKSTCARRSDQENLMQEMQPQWRRRIVETWARSQRNAAVSELAVEQRRKARRRNRSRCPRSTRQSTVFWASASRCRRLGIRVHRCRARRAARFRRAIRNHGRSNVPPTSQIVERVAAHSSSLCQW